MKSSSPSSYMYRCGKLGHTLENCEFKLAICYLIRLLVLHHFVRLTVQRLLVRLSTCSSTDVVKTLKKEHEESSEYTFFTIPAKSPRPPLYTTVSVDNNN